MSISTVTSPGPSGDVIAVRRGQGVANCGHQRRHEQGDNENERADESMRGSLTTTCR